MTHTPGTQSSSRLIAISSNTVRRVEYRFLHLIRGVAFSYEAVREWEAKLTPILSDELRQRRRRCRLAPSWYVDETYIKVRGRWCYTSPRWR